MSLSKNNISLLQVACLIGETTTNSNGVTVLDTRLSKVCTSDNINIFSKFKPLAYVGDPSSDATWYKGIDNTCGINIPVLGSDFSVIDSSTWTLQKPNGGSNSPYRLFFFGGYNHDAIPIVRSGINDDVTVNRGTDTTWTYYPYVIVNPGSDNINLDDIYLGDKLIGDCYVALQITTGGASWFACSKNTIRNYPTLTFDLSTFSSAQIDVKMTARLFLCGETFEQCKSWTVQDIVRCMWKNSNNLTTFGFTVKEDATFYISVQKLSASLQTGASYYVDFSNYTSESPLILQATNGMVYILCNFVNKSTGAWSIPLSSLRGKSTNWWGGNISRTVPAVYTTTGTRVTSAITLPANSTVQYVIQWSYNYKTNTALTTAPFSTKIKGNVTFNYLNGTIYIDVNSGGNSSASWYVQSSED